MLAAYLATNLIDSGVTITPSSEDSTYPVENLFDRHAANVFRSTSLTSLSIEIDLTASLAANTIAIINHNITGSATITLKANNTSPPTSLITTLTYRERDIWKAFASTSARYWLLEISDSNSESLEIGELVLGSRIAFPEARRIGLGYRPAIDRNQISAETYAGVLWNYNLFSRRTFNPSFRIGSSSDFATLANLDTTTVGNLFPFVYIPDASGVDCYYVRKERPFEPEEINRIVGGELVHDYSMLLIEESSGLEILS